MTIVLWRVFCRLPEHQFIYIQRGLGPESFYCSSEMNFNHLLLKKHTDILMVLIYLNRIWKLHLLLRICLSVLALITKEHCVTERTLCHWKNIVSLKERCVTERTLCHWKNIVSLKEHCVTERTLCHWKNIPIGNWITPSLHSICRTLSLLRAYN